MNRMDWEGCEIFGYLDTWTKSEEGEGGISGIEQILLGFEMRMWRDGSTWGSCYDEIGMLRM